MSREQAESLTPAKAAGRPPATPANGRFAAFPAQIAEIDRRLYTSLALGVVGAAAGIIFNTVSRGEQNKTLSLAVPYVTVLTGLILLGSLVVTARRWRERKAASNERDSVVRRWRLNVPTFADGPEFPRDGFSIFEAVTLVGGGTHETLDFATRCHTWSDDKLDWVTDEWAPEKLAYDGPTHFELDVMSPRQVITLFAEYCFAVTSYNRKVWLAEQMVMKTSGFRKMVFSLMPAHRDIVSGI